MSFYAKKPKYKNKKVEIDGITFDSKGEGDYYQYLKYLERVTKGKIKIVELQPKIYLSKAKILYKPDFLIEEEGKLIYVDFKGMRTATFQLKRRLWKAYREDKLRIVSKKRKDFIIEEEVN